MGIYALDEPRIELPQDVDLYADYPSQKDLVDILERFRTTEGNRYGSNRGAREQCRVATAHFIGWAKKQYGIEIREAIFDFCNELDCYHRGYFSIEDYPIEPRGWNGFHNVVQLGNLFIDWTARQYNPRSPFPLLWIGTIY